MMHLTKVVGIAISALLLATLPFGLVSAEQKEIDRHIRLETGTTKEFGRGDYIALNMTQNGTLAFFAVVYGTQENPNAIILVSAYISYLGGAEVRDENGGIMVRAIGIPVLRIYAQALLLVIEFNDTGYPTLDGRVGAGNGVFDFTREGEGLEDFDITATEPIYKIVSLNRSWTRSEVVETSIVGNEQSKEWTFSLTATNVSYDKIWDNKGVTYEDGSRSATPDDGVVEKIELVFHVGARVSQENIMVPFYRVTLDGNNRVIASQEIDPRLYKGVSLDANFKYDHILQGWDYTAKSETSRLMLENLVIFGTFIPGIVQEWLDIQFVEDFVENGTGVAELETFTGGEVDITSNDDIPSEATLLTKDSIVFKDNWRKNGELTWVSDVTVDERAEKMYFQVHAGTTDLRIVNEKDDKFRGIALLGGYIYPAGSSIYHDPTFATGAMLVDIAVEVGLPWALFIGIAAVTTVASVGTALLLASRARRSRIPPNYGSF